MLQDLIVAADQRRASQGRRGARQSDAGHDGRPEHSRAVLMARPDPLAELVDRAAAPARHRRAQRAAARVSPAQDAARGNRRARARRCSRSRTASPTARSAATSPTSIPCVYCTARRSRRPRSSASSSSRKTSPRSRRRAAFKRPLSRADGRDRAAPGHRAGRSQDQGAARARRRRAASRKSSSRPIPTVEGEATALYLARLLKPLGVARHAHRDGRARRQRPRLHGRVHDVQSDGRTTRNVTIDRVPEGSWRFLKGSFGFTSALCAASLASAAAPCRRPPTRARVRFGRARASCRCRRAARSPARRRRSRLDRRRA